MSMQDTCANAKGDTGCESLAKPAVVRPLAIVAATTITAGCLVFHDAWNRRVGEPQLVWWCNLLLATAAVFAVSMHRRNLQRYLGFRPSIAFALAHMAGTGLAFGLMMLLGVAVLYPLKLAWEGLGDVPLLQSVVMLCGGLLLMFLPLAGFVFIGTTIASLLLGGWTPENPSPAPLLRQEPSHYGFDDEMLSAIVLSALPAGILGGTAIFLLEYVQCRL